MNMSVKSVQLREERAGLVSKAQAILRQDKISVSDRETYDRHMQAAEALVPQIQNEERNSVETVYETRHVIDNFGARRESKAEQEYRMSFVRAMRLGLDRLSNGPSAACGTSHR